jgi:hypothetical protein
MPGGRPTEYNQEVVDAAWDYVDNYADHGHAVPSVVGLCKVINRGKSTLYDWAKDKDKEFSDILAAINENQELVAFNKSLTNEYNSTIAKLLLGKHGYSEKQQQEISGPDGGPVEHSYTVEVIDATPTDT